MSIEFQVTEVLPGTPDRVFQALTDLDAAAQWMPGYVSIERTGDVRQGVGTRWRETRRMFGREATEEFEVTLYHPPTHLALRVDGTRGSSGRGTFEFDYRLAQRVGGTEVRMSGRVDGLPPVMRWLSGILKGPYKSACARDLRALAQHLRETRPAPAAAAS